MKTLCQTDGQTDKQSDTLSSCRSQQRSHQCVLLLHILGGEVVSIAGVLVVDCVVATGVVGTLDPDLAQVAVPALALGLGVRDDDVDPRQELAGLHEGEGVGAAPLHQRHPVVSQGPQVNKHSGRVRRGGALQILFLNVKGVSLLVTSLTSNWY